MKNKIIFFISTFSLIFIFVIFYKGLNNPVLYEPKSKIKDIPEFEAKFFLENKEVSSRQIFTQNKFYLFNIWASWCVPCRKEHALLSNLSKFKELEIIGLNYKDDPN